MGNTYYGYAVAQFKAKVCKPREKSEVCKPGKLESIFKLDIPEYHIKSNTLHYDNSVAFRMIISEKARINKIKVGEFSPDDLKIYEKAESELQSKKDLIEQNKNEIDTICGKIINGISIRVDIDYEPEFKEWKENPLDPTLLEKIELALPAWQQAHAEFKITFESILSFIKVGKTIEKPSIPSQFDIQKTQYMEASSKCNTNVAVHTGYFESVGNALQVFIEKHERPTSICKECFSSFVDQKILKLFFK